MFFFSCLRHRKNGLKLIDKANESKNWPKACTVSILDPISFTKSDVKGGGWFKPKLWNQGGYDAIFIDMQLNLVRFVQVANGETHDLKLEYMYSFLICFKEICGLDEVEIEIVFVVSKKNLRKFKLKTESEEIIMKDEFGWTVSDCQFLALNELWKY